jgi:membrane protein
MNLPLPITRRARVRSSLVLRTLRQWPWFDTLRTLHQRFREDHLALSASSLTFTTLISLVPLVTVMLALFTAFPMFSRFQIALQQYFLQSLVPDNIAQPVLRALTQFAGQASKLGGLGLIVLGLTALTLIFTIDRTLNAIWRVPRPRPLAQRLLMYWAGLTLGPLLLGASLSLTSYALSASRGVVDAMPGGLSLLLAVVAFLLLAGGMAALFRYLPNTHVKGVHAAAGGLFVAVGFELAKRGLGWYVSVVPTYSVVYGAFATLPILLLWVYLSWVIVLLGAVIAAYAPSLAMRAVSLPDLPGERFALALTLLQALNQSRKSEQPGLSANALAAALHTDPLQVEFVLDALVTLGWCGRLDEAGAQRHVLLINPAHVPAQPLIDLLLLSDRHKTQAFRRHAQLATMTVADLLA